MEGLVICLHFNYFTLSDLLVKSGCWDMSVNVCTLERILFRVPLIVLGISELSIANELALRHCRRVFYKFSVVALLAVVIQERGTIPLMISLWSLFQNGDALIEVEVISGLVFLILFLYDLQSMNSERTIPENQFLRKCRFVPLCLQ